MPPIIPSLFPRSQSIEKNQALYREAKVETKQAALEAARDTADATSADGKAQVAALEGEIANTP